MVVALSNSPRGMLLLEVETGLALDERSNGVLKTEVVTGNSTLEVLGIVVGLTERLGGALATVVDITGMSGGYAGRYCSRWKAEYFDRCSCDHS